MHSLGVFSQTQGNLCPLALFLACLNCIILSKLWFLSPGSADCHTLLGIPFPVLLFTKPSRQKAWTTMELTLFVSFSESQFFIACCPLSEDFISYSLLSFLGLYGRRASLVTITLSWLKVEIHSVSVLLTWFHHSLSISLLSGIIKYFKYKKAYTSLIWPWNQSFLQEALVPLSEGQYLETKIRHSEYSLLLGYCCF